MAITCKLWAGMGNQIFMLAAGYAYGIKHKMPFFAPKQTIAPNIWKTYFPQFPMGKPNGNFFHYKETEHFYQEIPVKENILIEGYFQSEKYFSHCRQEIIDAFQIPYKKLDGFVSLHVRRGDYLQYPDKHPVITYEYISETVKLFIEKGFYSFVVCSDDIPWCRKNLEPLKLFGAEFSFSHNNEPIADLALMACCEHNIIANSSFSWWSAWLNQNSEKIVIAPKIWFGPGNEHLNTKDLIPETWLTM